MPAHRENRYLPYTRGQLFELVADIESYPRFLPWCKEAYILNRLDQTSLEAELVIGWRLLRESFRSLVYLEPDNSIRVVGVSGPFTHLRNEWRFVPTERAGCRVFFDIEFECAPGVLHLVITSLFGEAVRRLVRAFEQRARRLYAPVSAIETRPPNQK